MIAIDETAVYIGDGSQSTIAEKGASSIYISSTGYESARVTCILAIRLDGSKVPPLIIKKILLNAFQASVFCKLKRHGVRRQLLGSGSISRCH